MGLFSLSNEEHAAGRRQLHRAINPKGARKAEDIRRNGWPGLSRKADPAGWAKASKAANKGKWGKR